MPFFSEAISSQLGIKNFATIDKFKDLKSAPKYSMQENIPELEELKKH